MELYGLYNTGRELSIGKELNIKTEEEVLTHVLVQGL